MAAGLRVPFDLKVDIPRCGREARMAFSDFERRRIEKEVATFVESRRPPAHLRAELDLAFRVSGQSIEIFEVRPAPRAPGEQIELEVAKATYVKTQGVWKVYWQRADLKWHGYGPCPEVDTVREFLDIVGEDAYCCFFG
jgi:hypothetical protein